MKKTAYGKPLVIKNNGEVVKIKKIPAVDEISIQKLIFNHPECLPISQIDESYNPLIPVCMELNTPVGPLDVLMITPNGEIAIIETKLWRNAEARRVVVAQILDYAKELSKWYYEDLQREINRKLGRKKNTLYELAKSTNPNLTPPEADFVDSVSRNLEKGRFLLLIVGDGIREGAAGISEFLSLAANLNFIFAMVELNLYSGDEIGTLVIPKTIVKTVEIQKLTVEIPPGFTLSQTDEYENNNKRASTSSPEWEKEKAFYFKFWQELIKEITFDDPGQPLPNPSKAQNLYTYPGNTKKAWIGAYFAKSSSEVGVYFKTQNDQEGKDIKQALDEYEDAIKQELPIDLSWWNWNENGSCGINMNCQDIFDTNNREILKNFFSTMLNHFVNVFRPRMKSIGH